MYARRAAKAAQKMDKEEVSPRNTYIPFFLSLHREERESDGERQGTIHCVLSAREKWEEEEEDEKE